LKQKILYFYYIIRTKIDKERERENKKCIKLQSIIIVVMFRKFLRTKEQKKCEKKVKT